MTTTKEMTAQKIDEQPPPFPLRTSVTTQPAPLTVSPSESRPAAGSLDVLVSCGPFDSPEFQQLNIVFTVADGWDNDDAEILTPDWETVVASIDLPAGWERDTSQDIKGRFTFAPKDQKAKPNDTLRLHLDIERLSAKIGITNVVFTIKPVAHQTRPEPVIIPLGKFPPGFSLTNFRADDPIVEYGEATKIRWDVSGDQGVSYEYYVNGQKSPLPSAQIKSPMDTGPLQRVTVYKLHAKYQVGSEWTTHDSSAVVHVNRGDIIANNITANNAEIAGMPPSCAKLVKKYDFPVNNSTKNWNIGNPGRPDDGLIVGILLIDSAEHVEASITLELVSTLTPTSKVTVTSPNSTFPCDHFVALAPAEAAYRVFLKTTGNGEIHGYMRLYWMSMTNNYTPPTLR
ncbi:hypothetical protein E1287_36155 [Actinomadura sp. KC06]|uniref:hypothetical protein n=1 Tax=Actinomadura sp. KC06 TaxID=2530369 RepID=UPI001046D3CC|nr:hypothetical protein [Actinomadura sp. KC06]TDD26655.1 hypothetical protein E1287_36155 [Actinomadura sp. KC06]